MKITCAILCYNYGRYLSRAIDSCLNQDWDGMEHEVLIVDDGSTDSTQEVCAMYEGRVRVSRTENLGFARSLARAVEEAKGEYVAYLDADDYWCENKIRVLRNFLDSSRVLLVIHPMLEVDAEGSLLGTSGACGNTSSVCVYREAALTLLPGTSELYCHPLLDSGRGVVLHDALGFYRIHAKSMTDRTVTSAHCEFFARTSHCVADRLFELAQDPPFWEVSSAKLMRLSKQYRATGYMKDFERVTELGRVGLFLPLWLKMVRQFLLAQRMMPLRAWRLTVRAMLLVAKLKNRR